MGLRPAPAPRTSPAPRASGRGPRLARQRWGWRRGPGHPAVRAVWAYCTGGGAYCSRGGAYSYAREGWSVHGRAGLTAAAGRRVGQHGRGDSTASPPAVSAHRKVMAGRHWPRLGAGGRPPGRGGVMGHHGGPLGPSAGPLRRCGAMWGGLRGLGALGLRALWSGAPSVKAQW